MAIVPGATCCTKANIYGWRHLMFTLGGITLFVFILWFVAFQESPRFLLAIDNHEEALKVLHKVAQTNKRMCSITRQTFAALTIVDIPRDSPSLISNDLTEKPFLALSGVTLEDATFLQKVNFKLRKVKMLFCTATLARLTILVWIIYVFDYWGFSIAGDYKPGFCILDNSSIS